MRVVFMGTPEFAVPVLEALIHSEHQVVGVFCQPDEPAGRGRSVVSPPVKRVALQHGLAVHQPPSLRRSCELERLASLRPDVAVIAAYGKILPESFLHVPPHGFLNVHASLLPRHRGPSPIAAAILAGDEVTGVTIMKVTKVMDTGPILAQCQIPILPHDTTGSLSQKLSGLGAELLMETLPLWLEGRLAPQPQDNDKATYCRMITKEDGLIDWHRPAVELWRRVRAFQPWPGSYTTWQGRVLKIIEALPLPGSGTPGRVVAMSQESGAPVGVHTGEGVLGLIQVQLEGKRVMNAAEFLRGQRGFIEAQLPS
ncbi:MAG: methionyl-tRNA formyltransferase [Dehalococcoidia bacterium]|nr:methionyl-tRNA formyltransferase [Dehalococcoidia bacterium]